MATLDSFEELDCWKSAQEVLKITYKVLAKESVRKEFSFQDQMKRAALSVSNNIAEGFERSTTKEKLRFLSYANGSIAEVKNMLYAAKNIGFIDQSEFDSTFAITAKCQSQLKGFMRYLHSIKTS